MEEVKSEEELTSSMPKEEGEMSKGLSGVESCENDVCGEGRTGDSLGGVKISIWGFKFLDLAKKCESREEEDELQ